MVFLGLYTWRQGIKNPNIIKTMDFVNPTGTDKLLMARVRIWGPSIPTHIGSGYKGWQKKPEWHQDKKLSDIPTNKPFSNHPYFDFRDAKQAKIDSQESKKFKYMMKGVKVGRKKGGGKVELMSVFEKKK